VFYVRFPLQDVGRNDIVVASGGVPYRPGREQLPNSCQDFHAVDDRVLLGRGTASRCLQTLDAALVEFGGIHDGLRLASLPDNPGDIHVAVYNNVWYTNFAGDESGVMEFEFELYAGGTAATRFSPHAFAVVRV